MNMCYMLPGSLYLTTRAYLEFHSTWSIVLISQTLLVSSGILSLGNGLYEISPLVGGLGYLLA